MYRTLLFFVSVGLILLFLAGCSQAPVSTTALNSATADSAPVSLTMTDEPPNGVTVLFFQISLTAAYLTPASGSGNVSLLSNNTPIQIDVTQLQAASAFLSTASVPAGIYNSLTITFANPQLVIFNAADQALATAGTCPLNTTCQLTPQIDNSSTLTFSSAPFPVTVAQNTPLGFLLDFHLNQVIQSDLSVNLGVANGVTVKQLPPGPPSGPPQFGFVVGTVQSVGQNQFTLQTRDGRTFTIDVNSSTSYENFPSSVCATNGFSCLAPGQIVKVQVASVQADGTLLAAEVSYIQSATQQVVEGDIIGLSTSNGSTVMTLLLHWTPDAGKLPFGGVASVTVPSTAAFSVDWDGFTNPGGLSFASASDLLVGQEVQVVVVAGSLSSPGNSGRWAPPAVSFTTDSVGLEPSQITGTVTTISEPSFTITTFPFFAPWFNPNWTPTQITVQTTSQTTYQGLTPDSFSGLTTGSLVSVRGWLFSTPGGPTASTMVAETVIGRAEGVF